jgi:hypothetical protein
MPREMFSPSVVGVSTAARRGRLFPLSIALHACILGSALVLPLTADSVLPLTPPRVVFARPVPPPLGSLNCRPDPGTRIRVIQRREQTPRRSSCRRDCRPLKAESQRTGPMMARCLVAA